MYIDAVYITGVTGVGRLSAGSDVPEATYSKLSHM